MESKDYLKNKHNFNIFNNMILKTTEKQLFEVTQKAKNQFITNIKNLEGNLVKLTQRREKVKNIKKLESEISDINRKTQQDLASNFDEERNKLVADKSKILKELDESRRYLIEEIKSNNINRLVKINEVFEV